MKNFLSYITDAWKFKLSCYQDTMMEADTKMEADSTTNDGSTKPDVIQSDFPFNPLPG